MLARRSICVAVEREDLIWGMNAMTELALPLLKRRSVMTCRILPILQSPEAAMTAP